MSNSTAQASSGIGFFGLLTVAFIVLKLCKVITWSWWYVLMPFWIWFAILGGVLLLAGVVAVVAVAVLRINRYVRRKRILRRHRKQRRDKK